MFQRKSLHVYYKCPLTACFQEASDGVLLFDSSLKTGFIDTVLKNLILNKNPGICTLMDILHPLWKTQ